MPNDLGWRKSRRSGANGQCVEVAALGQGIAARDSNDPHRTLMLGAEQWRALLAGIKRGEHDPRPATS